MPILILIIGIIMIISSSIMLRKNQDKENEDNLFNTVLQTNKDDLKEYKYEIGVLRKDIGESLAELQNDILNIRDEINAIKEKKQFPDNNNDIGVNKEIDMAEKAQKIKQLLDNGMSNEEICRQLDISKGEVLLVADLYKK